MEDSGIDSGDKLHSICFETENGHKENIIFMESDNSSNENVEVIYRNPSLGNSKNGNKILLETGLASRISSSSSSGCNNDGITDNLSLFNKNNSNATNFRDTTEALNQINSCKVLQRKLELKVEKAKRNYNQLQEEKEQKPRSTTLIPISRLQIPGCPENVPLVEYNSDSNNNDDDDDEISFFPIKTKHKKQDLSDTFSIQEMTIESDTDGSESGSLELLPPVQRDRTIEKCLTCMFCIDAEGKCCTIM